MILYLSAYVDEEQDRGSTGDGLGVTTDGGAIHNHTGHGSSLRSGCVITGYRNRDEGHSKVGYPQAEPDDCGIPYGHAACGYVYGQLHGFVIRWSSDDSRRHPACDSWYTYDLQFLEREAAKSVDHKTFLGMLVFAISVSIDSFSVGVSLGMFAGDRALTVLMFGTVGESCPLPD